MRRGMTLVELLALFPVLVAVLIISGMAYPTLIRDPGKIQQAVQTNRGLGHMVRTIRQDVDAAESLPSAAGEKLAGQTTLLLRMADHVVCYQADEDGVARMELSDRAGRQVANRWTLPNSEVRFERLQRDGAYEAVLLRTAILYTGPSHTAKRLANTHVFFLGAMPMRRVQP